MFFLRAFYFYITLNKEVDVLKIRANRSIMCIVQYPRIATIQIVTITIKNLTTTPHKYTFLKRAIHLIMTLFLTLVYVFYNLVGTEDCIARASKGVKSPVSYGSSWVSSCTCGLDSAKAPNGRAWSLGLSLDKTA